jgi:hypothetical protein
VSYETQTEDGPIEIIKTQENIALEFGPYYEPIDTDIKITLVDAVGNA